MTDIDFNALRKQAIDAYERLVKKLNASIGFDESIKCMGIGKTIPAPHYCFGGTCDSIKEEMDELRTSLTTIGELIDTDDPSVKNVMQEMFPHDPCLMDGPSPSLTKFHPMAASEKRQKAMRIGLFFGSFNPLTNAHVALAKGALDAGALDGVWFVLSPANPAKFKKNILADEEHRREMMRAFIAADIDARLELCDIEYDMPRPSYTHKTLCALKEKHPHLDFIILCGTDTLSKILSWKTGDLILKENRFICQARGTGKYEWSQEVRDKTLFLDLEVPDISSTLVRGNISTGAAYKELVPASIAAYIEEHGLYR